ncbi:hypothetical protein BN903_8 [Halorubrum sp. AJ67]|nr:hypothetical protein BN903_8 [Halorubrum sp. AJ67]
MRSVASTFINTRYGPTADMCCPLLPTVFPEDRSVYYQC